MLPMKMFILDILLMATTKRGSFLASFLYSWLLAAPPNATPANPKQKWAWEFLLGKYIKY